ncbi:PTI1-like tyrosine-protein kinase [Hibiscus syriacus]|uniref:non-specific serine/threonine protein kinase n=1 Tax=Hibiscus syriacus TaxID=106335 RepID=A0A6A3A912_HIBSY|nr:PTI1-like tyrosine-protein kinase [Hibiscus syriacus]
MAFVISHSDDTSGVPCLLRLQSKEPSGHFSIAFFSFNLVIVLKVIHLQIAVKRLKVWSNKAEVQFAVEVEILARVRHKNLLSLRGYCAEGQERLIVYNYMPNRSLLSHLHGHHSAECLLDWTRRMNIAIGSAEGIAQVYLHHHSTPHVIHQDIKASNVLLNSDFQPQVVDFGFAKFIPDSATHVTTRVKGTVGYLAPEYAMLRKASESCDVYSFGVLLLELVSGKRPLEKYVEEELKRVVLVALVCADNRPEKIPTMLEVVELLKGESQQKLSELENNEVFKYPQFSVCNDESLGIEESSEIIKEDEHEPVTEEETRHRSPQDC